MRTLDIMVDIDDVLFPLAPELHRVAHEMGLHDNSQEALEVWHGWKQYGCHKQDWLDVFARLADEHYYLTAAPIPGALEAVRHLWWLGHNVHLVTARGFAFEGDAHDHSAKIREWTTQWIEDHAVPHVGPITFTKDKVAAGPWDYAIDDGDHNYVALDNAGVRVYLLDQPHNRAFEAERRVHTVAEFVDIILEEAA